jgi:hypothetical protein
MIGLASRCNGRNAFARIGGLPAIGCPGIPSVVPYIHFDAHGQAPASDIALGLVLCDACARAATSDASFLVPDHLWTSLVAQLREQGLNPPPRSKMRITVQPITPAVPRSIL